MHVPPSGGSLCNRQMRQQQYRVEYTLLNVWRTLNKASGLGMWGWILEEGPSSPVKTASDFTVHLYPKGHFLRTFYGHLLTLGKTEVGGGVMDGVCCGWCPRPALASRWSRRPTRHSSGLERLQPLAVKFRALNSPAHSKLLMC